MNPTVHCRSFDDLPEGAQRAIHAWNRDHGEAVVAARRAQGFTYTIETVPADDLKARIMADPDLAANWSDFAAYHAWYLSCGDVPEHATRWPVIAAQPGEGAALDDGWHRVHHYFRSGDPTIQVLHVHPPTVERP